MKKFLILCLIISTFFASFSLTRAQENKCTNTQNLNLLGLTQCLADLEKALNLSRAATAPLESQLNSYQLQINGIKKRIAAIEANLIVKQSNIERGEKDLAKQTKILNQTVVNHYISNYLNNFFSLLLSGTSATNVIQNLAYQKAIANRDKAIIINIALSILDLKTQKENLSAEQVKLTALKATLDEQSGKLDKIVSGAKAYQSTLSGQIAQLSALQQAILTGKSGTFTTSVGDVPLADDPNASPNYNPGFSPAFAGFSFGAYTHRKGMSQYGAKARAQAPYNQDANTILRAYYGKDPVGKDTNGSIRVTGFAEMDFEGRYLLGIAEMPSSWHMQALKAQAIAARTYAYRYKQNGQEICITQSCQVYLSSKADNPPAEWRQAVEQTRGQVIEDVVTFYSSTTGGYITTLGWDTTSGNKDTWTSGAYEKLAGSPWFYKGWYTKEYYVSSDKCGRISPWLNQEEMSDILNAYLIQNKSGVDNGRITPVTTGCWGGNPYSTGEARDLANSVGGGAVTSISNVSVVYSNDGKTANLTFTTNKGEIPIAGADFKQIFNLRAPGYISIRSALYNIERK